VEVHDTIEDMLRYVHLQPEDLISRYLDKIVRAELTSDERGAFLNELKQGLKRSSYLTV
jgi:arginine decarboxylase